MTKVTKHSMCLTIGLIILISKATLHLTMMSSMSGLMQALRKAKLLKRKTSIWKDGMSETRAEAGTTRKCRMSSTNSSKKTTYQNSQPMTGTISSLNLKKLSPCLTKARKAGKRQNNTTRREMKTLTVDGGTLEMARKNGKKGNS